MGSFGGQGVGGGALEDIIFVLKPPFFVCSNYRASQSILQTAKAEVISPNVLEKVYLNFEHVSD